MCIENNQFDLLMKLSDAAHCPSLKNVVLFEEPTEAQKEKASQHDIKLYSYAQVVEIGGEHPEVILTDPKPETIYMFCYTSGTTGDPKGAKMDHQGFMAVQHLYVHAGLNFTNEDCSISYLPLAHIFE